MGYSIMTPFGSRKAQRQMLRFMESNYRNPNEIRGTDLPVFMSAPTDDIAYSTRREKFLVGINYKPVEFEDGYAEALCFWMALTAGKRKRFRNGGTLPFVIYDGHEDWPLVIRGRSFNPKLKPVIVDEFGFHPSAKIPAKNIGDVITGIIVTAELSRYIEQENEERARNDEQIRNELVRLTEAYRSLVGEKK